MLVPIRCFTCGGLIADKFEDFQKRVNLDEDSAEILDSLGIKRYCCRRMFLTTLQTIQQIVPFYEAIYKRNVSVQSELE
jgi:DNA-directed RNA polymerase subunit N|tara:strand:- start:203 stop:439 length:237 start_codon:yes stop_codon:yes gene_type:complete